MKKAIYTFLPFMVLMIIGTIACTKVELVDNSDRATSSLLRVSFNWNGEGEIPPTVQLIAVRNIKTWRAHGYVNTNNGDYPWFGYSEPLIEEETVEPEPEPGTGIDSEVPYPFRLKGGEYNILAINKDLNSDQMELVCLSEEDENTDTSTDLNGTSTMPSDEKSSLEKYLTDYNRKANELFLRIKPMEEGVNPEPVIGKDLPDFNPKVNYIQRVPPIFYALHTGINVVPGTDTHLTLDMQPISQEIQIEFTIELEGDVEIMVDDDDNDDVVVELSGICGHFNLMEAYVDTTTLYRSVELAEKQTSTGNLHVYRASFYTLGVVPSFDPTYLNGPGVVQVAVKVASTKPDAPNKKGRYVYAGINPYTELNESKIIIEGVDGKPRLRFSREPIKVVVEKHLVINGEFLVEPGKGLGWEQQDPDNVDIEI